jgi:tRNA threonylcarbamoyladenosine biosynthesis protein TsaB
MKILAIEFSSNQRSVAVVQGDRAGNAIAENEAVATGPKAVGPLGLVEMALGEAGIEREQIECVAVGLGPGSYTGIRCAIALAQGWELARGTPLLGVSSAECLAAQAYAEGMTGQVHVLIDAQRGEFYLASYLMEPSGWNEIVPLALATPSDVRAGLESGGVPVGPEAPRWFSHGRQMLPRAATLGRLAMKRTDFLSGNRLEPIYLRETAFVKAPAPRRYGSDSSGEASRR